MATPPEPSSAFLLHAFLGLMVAWLSVVLGPSLLPLASLQHPSHKNLSLPWLQPTLYFLTLSVISAFVVGLTTLVWPTQFALILQSQPLADPSFQTGLVWAAWLLAFICFLVYTARPVLYRFGLLGGDQPNIRQEIERSSHVRIVQGDVVITEPFHCDWPFLTAAGRRFDLLRTHADTKRGLILHYKDGTSLQFLQLNDQEADPSHRPSVFSLERGGRGKSDESSV